MLVQLAVSALGGVPRLFRESQATLLVQGIASKQCVCSRVGTATKVSSPSACTGKPALPGDHFKGHQNAILLVSHPILNHRVTLKYAASQGLLSLLPVVTPANSSTACVPQIDC